MTDVRDALIGLNDAIDMYWNEGRTDSQVKNISYWQLKSKEALTATPAVDAVQGALELYLKEVQPVDGRAQINISLNELNVLRSLAATPAVGGEREVLENILQRLRGPASAVISDIRKIVQDALAPPSCTCPCSCDETPHDGKPCPIHYVQPASPLPAVGGEPVAWRWRHVNSPSKDWNYQQQPIGNHNEYLEVEPLYAGQPKWECMGRKQSLPEPGECNWPDCGCDPRATKVIESLIEQGWTAAQPASPLRAECKDCPHPDFCRQQKGCEVEACLAATPAVDGEVPSAFDLTHQRYWESRWRDEKAENDQLRAAPEAINDMVRKIGEPVAWRWRPCGAVNWIYDPTPEWRIRMEHENSIEIEPLFAAQPASPLRGREALVDLVDAVECELDIEYRSFAFRKRFSAAKAALASPPEQPAAMDEWPEHAVSTDRLNQLVRWANDPNSTYAELSKSETKT